MTFFDVLTLIGGLSLSEIANLLDLPKSTISSILKPLGATSQ